MKEFYITELKHEDKNIGSITVDDDMFIEPYLRGIFSIEYGDMYKHILADFDYNAVINLPVHDTYTHYLRSDWTIDVSRIK